MKHPFQCIATVKPAGHEKAYLLAASGPKLLSTCLTTGDVVSEWTANDPSSNGRDVQVDGKNNDENGQGASKKQKTLSQHTLPNVIKLSVTADQLHALAVTDDKCLRVFQVQSDGQLVELSSRAMPKRPCAIHTTSDNATILCGDKFGDVYSLPLFLKEPEPKSSKDETSPTPHPENKPFKPSATTQTVHTQRNRKALEAQMKQKNLTPKTKQPLAFHHKLLLGHVSMLTDMQHATREVDGKQLSYILTSDRDEHIRVSRGPPQSHIIETYCLGHQSFVSKICVLPGTDLLLSGGGDEWLGLWDWPTGRLRLDLWNFGDGMRDVLNANAQPEHIAVSGIWRITVDYDDRTADAVLVACEGLPALMDTTVAELVRATSDSGPMLSFSPTGAPVLDVACVESTIYISLDVREDGEAPIRVMPTRIKGLEDGTTYLEDGEGRDGVAEARLQKLVDRAATVGSGEEVDGLVYGVAKLRKRAHYGGGGDEEGEDAVEAEAD